MGIFVPAWFGLFNPLGPQTAHGDSLGIGCRGVHCIHQHGLAWRGAQLRANTERVRGEGYRCAGLCRLSASKQCLRDPFRF